MLRRAIRNLNGVGVNGTKLIRRVVVETERTFIFRSRGSRELAWCLACGSSVEMACVEVAAHQARTSELAIYQLIESGAVHSVEDAEGRLFVCVNSLKQWNEQKGATS
jgi:hypothetical protein